MGLGRLFIPSYLPDDAGTAALWPPHWERRGSSLAVCCIPSNLKRPMHIPGALRDSSWGRVRHLWSGQPLAIACPGFDCVFPPPVPHWDKRYLLQVFAHCGLCTPWGPECSWYCEIPVDFLGVLLPARFYWILLFSQLPRASLVWSFATIINFRLLIPGFLGGK